MSASPTVCDLRRVVMALEAKGVDQHNMRILLGLSSYSDPTAVLTGSMLNVYHEKKRELRALRAMELNRGSQWDQENVPPSSSSF
ncbi:hypothetical protein PT974_08356 [Cladobotryum mycophilum]|uniref:Uncharacterized protein n=1 Tax=Cladobotryum mycophilum TaxID=491253 RepID=A0ABR0SE45_9HYPO